MRSDNGLLFQSRRFRAAMKDYCLTQEFITPYTPEQNGILERFFRSLKEGCIWQYLFQNFNEAQGAIRNWIRWYNEERPHQSLGYLSPPSTGPNNYNWWLEMREGLQARNIKSSDYLYQLLICA